MTTRLFWNIFLFAAPCILLVAFFRVFAGGLDGMPEPLNFPTFTSLVNSFANFPNPLGPVYDLINMFDETAAHPIEVHDIGSFFEAVGQFFELMGYAIGVFFTAINVPVYFIAFFFEWLGTWLVGGYDASLVEELPNANPLLAYACLNVVV